MAKKTATKRKQPAAIQVSTGCPICGQQSPIVIDRGKIVPHEKWFNPDIKLWPNYPLISHEGNKLSVHGPSGLLTFPASEGKLEEQFVFNHMHFHHPNEHYLIPEMPLPRNTGYISGGLTAEMTDEGFLEIHLVFQALKEFDPCRKEPDRFAVIALIVKAEPGAQYPLFAGLVESLPGFGQHAVSKYVLDLNKAFSKAGESVSSQTEFLGPDRFYYYQGSLTTYPFTGGVHWLIYKEIIGADPLHIERFGELLKSNVRSIQDVTTPVYGPTNAPMAASLG